MLSRNEYAIVTLRNLDARSREALLARHEWVTSDEMITFIERSHDCHAYCVCWLVAAICQQALGDLPDVTT